MNVQKLRNVYRQRQALADENRGYAPLELIKLLIMLLSGEMKTAAASVKTRKLEQIKQVQNRLVKEIEKLRHHGTEPLKLHKLKKSH